MSHHTADMLQKHSEASHKTKGIFAEFLRYIVLPTLTHCDTYSVETFKISANPIRDEMS